MASALNAFMQISNAKGESKQGNGSGGNGEYKDWIEIQGWEWEVEAETSWTKGGGASVGKPSPGQDELGTLLGPFLGNASALHLHRRRVR